MLFFDGCWRKLINLASFTLSSKQRKNRHTSTNDKQSTNMSSVLILVLQQRLHCQSVLSISKQLLDLICVVNKNHFEVIDELLPHVQLVRDSHQQSISADCPAFNKRNSLHGSMTWAINQHLNVTNSNSVIAVCCVEQLSINIKLNNAWSKQEQYR